MIFVGLEGAMELGLFLLPTLSLFLVLALLNDMVRYDSQRLRELIGINLRFGYLVIVGVLLSFVILELILEIADSVVELLVLQF